MALAFLGADATQLNIAATSNPAPLPSFSGSPLFAAGDLLVVVVLGTPDTTVGTPTVSMPAGWTLIEDHVQDVATLDTDLSLHAFCKFAEAGDLLADPTVSVSAGYGSTGGSSNTRWSILTLAYSGAVGDPRDAVTSGLTTPTSPWTPAQVVPTSAGGVREVAAFTIVAQRYQNVGAPPALATANGFSSAASLVSGGLARSMRVARRSGLAVADGAVTMPTFTVNTSLATSALASISFAVPEVVSSGWYRGRIIAAR